MWLVTIQLIILWTSLLEAETDTTSEASAGRDTNWAEKFRSCVEARNAIIPKLEAFVDEVTSDTVEDLIETFDAVPETIHGLDNLNLDAEQDESEVAQIRNLQTSVRVSQWFTSENLETYYTTRGFGHILDTFQQSLPSSGPFSGENLPLSDMCGNVLQEIGENDRFEISVDTVCRSVKECSGKNTKHPYGDETGTDLQEICVEDTNACKVTEAIPVMTALLWYKISDFIALGFCYNHLDNARKTVVKAKYRQVMNMASLISAYLSTLENWREVFDAAVRQRAFSDLPLAMEKVEEKAKSFKFASLACSELKADDMCTIGSIFTYYSSLSKLKQDKENPPMTRNLQFHARVDHAKLLELKRESLQKVELLGNIQQLDHNVGNLVEGMSNYFYQLAKYDEGIADQDRLFLKGKLDDFMKKAEEISTKLQKDVKGVMIAAQVALGLQLTLQTSILVAQIAQHANIAKLIFSGVDIVDMYERAGKVAKAVEQLGHGIALLSTFSRVYEDMADLSSKLQDNRDQIANLTDMVKSIQENSVHDINFDSQRFIESYGAYTPKVNRADLAKNDALWSAYKDSACDLLFGTEGGGTVELVTGGMLLCEKLEGTLAEFFALRENIFDFQFDLVDSLASIVRGNIAKKLAKDIDLKNDRLQPDALLLAFLMTQYRLQSEATLYCTKLEYINQGQTISPCQSTNFFDKNQLEHLMAYDYGTLYHEDERFVYIPTKPQFPGDAGFINFPALAAGNETTFRIPANRTWLRQFNWLSSKETVAPFVAGFKLYLPLKTYTEGQQQTYSKTHIRLTSTAGSRVNENDDVVYDVPLEHSTYDTIYEEGYDSAKCPRGKEIMNPYSLCDNLPLLCDTMTRVPGTLVMPTILSTWKINYTIESGHTKLTWDAPRPATDLLIVAKLRLRFLPGNGRKRRAVGVFDGESAFGCCNEPNTYRPMWNDRTCKPCPTTPSTSQAKLRGYYCEKGNEAIAQEIPDSFYTETTTTPSTTTPLPTRPSGDEHQRQPQYLQQGRQHHRRQHLHHHQRHHHHKHTSK